MAKPLDEQTDEELETALAQGLLDERKAATAKEILSRRWQSKSEKIRGSYGWDRPAAKGHFTRAECGCRPSSIGRTSSSRGPSTSRSLWWT